MIKLALHLSANSKIILSSLSEIKSSLIVGLNLIAFNSMFKSNDLALAKKS